MSDSEVEYAKNADADDDDDSDLECAGQRAAKPKRKPDWLAEDPDDLGARRHRPLEAPQAPITDRVVVVAHMYCGPRRRDDVQHRPIQSHANVE